MADRFPLIIDNSAEKIKELVSGDNLDLTKSNLKNADYIQSAGVNVAGVATATSLIGDGSQLTNLPPSGGSLTATASGTLADGSKVIVNTDGTVSVVAQTETTGPGAESGVVFNSDDSHNNVAVYDSANQKVVIAYAAGNVVHGTAVVGTVSGTSISFGTPVVFESDTTQHISMVYDSTNQKVVIVYQDTNNGEYGTAIVGTVSGTSISFGSPTVFESALTYEISATYDSSNSKVVIAYKDWNNSQYGTAIVGTVSGTSISFGTPVVFNTANTTYTSATFDSTNNKVVISYNDGGNSGYGAAIVGTVSGTSISFGSPTTFNSGGTNFTKSTFDSSNNKVVIAYVDSHNSDYGEAVVGTVSGTSISFGTPVVFNSTDTDNVSATFDSTNNKIAISYRYKIGSSSNFGGRVITGTVSGTSISFGTPIAIDSSNTAWLSVGTSVTYDPTNDKVVVSYKDNANNNYGTAVLISQTGFSIPQLGSAAVFESADSREISAAYDSTNQKVVIAYRDDGNSQYGTAIVGTVSGTDISFGSPTVFESARSDDMSAVFDSSNGKVVIAYNDTAAGGYGTAIVGTVSGTDISFGSPTVFESADSSYFSATFDSSNNKIVIAYRDQGNNNSGTAVVGTVSGTSISFGTPVVFNSNYNTMYSTAVYDSANQKVVIAYTDNGNSGYGAAIVGTVSGTSISFGSSTLFSSGEANQISAAYDPTNQKVVIAYRDQGSTYDGKAVVGTVSGTSISFGSIATFESADITDTATIYDPSIQKVVVIYRDEGNSHYGTAAVGTVSGTSINFDTPFVFKSSRTQYVAATTYDTTNNKIVGVFSDYGNNLYGTAVVFSPVTLSTNLTAENFIGISNGAYSNGQTAMIQIMGAVDDAQSSLTPGQSYYVQTDGTLSTTADSPSVFAGTAIAATKLIVRG